MACDFPARSADQNPLAVEVRARPSLKDQPGLYRAMMDVSTEDDLIQMRAAAQPLSSKKSRGVLVSGKAPDRASGKAHFVIGVDDGGAAALSITYGDQDPPLQLTRTGTCRNHARYLRRWAPK